MTRGKVAAVLLAVHALVWLPPGQGAPAPFPRRVAHKPPEQRLLGNWKVVRTDVSGKHFALLVSAGQRWRIDAGRITVRYADGSRDEITYQLDVSRRPRWLDLTFVSERLKGLTFYGIYDLAGDELKICYSRGRPKAIPRFLDEHHRGVTLLVLKRE
jgi:uncharacterized protein (TIGR03067 family)